MKSEYILEIKNLNISFSQYDAALSKSEYETIKRLDVSVKKGEMVAVVGSSGSGKSLLAHEIMGILPYNAKVSGDVLFCGSPLTEERRKELIGRKIVLVPQSLSYLDPLQKTGRQILAGRETPERRKRLDNLLSRYHLPEKVKNLYPFELSGGMQRRVLVSTAVIESPDLVIADEPTPNLDLELAKRVMTHFRELADSGCGVLVITHDLELALETCDRLVIFHDGMSVHECRPSEFEKLKSAKEGFAKELYLALAGAKKSACKPCEKGYDKENAQGACDSLSMDQPVEKPISEKVILSAENLTFGYGDGQENILENFSLELREGEHIGIFAKSGRGKTTLCKLLSGYERPKKGIVSFEGKNIYDYDGYCPVQMIWQEQNLAVNPRMKMAKVLAEGDEVSDSIVKALGIRKEWMSRYRNELSGGEIQRFCIARALGKRTKVLVCDEITTMMDLVSRRKIWEFLLKETESRGICMIVVSHSRSLLENVCDRIIDL